MKLILILLIFVLFTFSYPAQDVSIQSENKLTEELLPVEVGGKWGFINKTGEIVIKPQFLVVDIFSEGLAPIATEANKKFGYINIKGEMIIAEQFDEAFPFKNGTARIVSGLNNDPNNYKHGKVGFIDKTGKIIINPQFDIVSDFNEGLALAQVKNKWGFINQAGEFIIQPQFEDAKDFSEGFAGVRKNNKWGFIDKTGKFVIKPKFDRAIYFSDDLAPVRLTRDGKWGYINKAGKTVLEYKFREARPFKDGIASIWTDKGYRCINKHGNFIGLEDCQRFNEGFSRIVIKNKWGFVGKNGKVVIKPQWDNVTDFENGVAAFFNYDSTHYGCGIYVPSKFYLTDACAKWGYINKAGKIIWQQE